MKLLKSYLLSISIFEVIFIVLLLIVSAIFAYTSISDNYINAFSYAIIIIPSVVSSFILSKFIKSKGLILGVINNIICMIFLLILYCFLNKSVSITNTYYIYLAVSVFCGILGGVAGVNV